jgi:nicotinamidase-related amidase
MATAVLCCDIQPDIIGYLAEADKEALLNKTNQILQKAREAKLPVIFIRVAFRPGYPEVSEKNLVRLFWLQFVVPEASAELHFPFALIERMCRIVKRPFPPSVSYANISRFPEQAFSTLPARGALVEGTPGADIHPSVVRASDDIVVTKRRFGGFSTTGSQRVNWIALSFSVLTPRQF